MGANESSITILTRKDDPVKMCLLSDPAGVNEAPPSPRAIVSVHLGASVEIGCRRDGRYHRGVAVHGDIDLIPPGTPSRWELKERDMALIVALPDNLLGMAAEESGADPAKIQIANRFQIRDLPLERLASALKAEADAGFPQGRTYFESLALALAGSLLERHSSNAAASRRLEYGMSGWRLRKTLDYIEENLNHDLSLKEIAAVAGLSVSHCKTAFTKSMGAPIHQYVIQRRVERAKQLLAQEGLSISQVAAEAGFTHKSHLAYHTRRVYGLSPTALRRRIALPSGDRRESL